MLNSENSVGQHALSTQDTAGPRNPTTEAGAIAAPAAARAALWGNIPHELRERAQWCITPGTDDDKAPRTVTGAYASSTDQATWTDFDTTCRAAHERDWHIGYMLSPDDPFTVIDFDVKDDTTREEMEEFWRLAQWLDSYAEVSRSGKGLHLFLRGKIGKGIKRKHVEFYSQERFIICTGDVRLVKPVEDRQ